MLLFLVVLVKVVKIVRILTQKSSSKLFSLESSLDGLKDFVSPLFCKHPELEAKLLLHKDVPIPIISTFLYASRQLEWSGFGWVEGERVAEAGHEVWVLSHN
jgi:hypothetical protein